MKPRRGQRTCDCGRTIQLVRRSGLYKGRCVCGQAWVSVDGRRYRRIVEHPAGCLTRMPELTEVPNGH